MPFYSAARKRAGVCGPDRPRVRSYIDQLMLWTVAVIFGRGRSVCGRWADEAKALLNAIKCELVPGVTGPAPPAVVEQLENLAAAAAPKSTPADMGCGSADVLRLRGGRGSPPASPFSKRPRQSATDPPPPPPHLPWTEVGELRDGDVMSYRTEEDDAPWHEGVARSNATTGMVTVKHTGSSSTLAVTTLSDWNSGNYNVDGTATLTSSWTISHALSPVVPITTPTY